MEMYGKVVELRYLLGAAIIFSLAILSTMFRASSLSTILFYFWPLILSTASVVVGMIVIGRISPINYSGDAEGEALFHYVAGQPAEMVGN